MFHTLLKVINNHRLSDLPMLQAKKSRPAMKS